MSGMAEFTPRGADEKKNSICNFLKPAPNGYMQEGKLKNAYSGISLLPLITKIPDDQVDVHSVVITTSYKATHHNRIWEGKEEDNNGR